jgi:hypothetical protein
VSNNHLFWNPHDRPIKQDAAGYIHLRPFKGVSMSDQLISKELLEKYCNDRLKDSAVRSDDWNGNYADGYEHGIRIVLTEINSGRLSPAPPGDLREALKKLIEVYDAMDCPRGPTRIIAEAALANDSGVCQCRQCLRDRNERTAYGWPVEASRMILCVICGNKRCPHATNHRNACTNSNEPGQPGSNYTTPKVEESE